jgi:hypothetical protein
MKTLKYFVGLVIICAALLFAETTKNSEVYNTPPAVSNTYRYEFTADTITNAENDTINMTVQFLDAWVPNVFLETTQLSGTQAINLIIQENSKLTGTTGWISVDTVALSGSSDLDRLSYPSAPYWVRGQRMRVIIDGSGTQSTRYTGRVIAKRQG